LVALAICLPGAVWAQGAGSSTPQQQIAKLETRLNDWAQLGYYRDANATLPSPAADQPRVVFFGASIVEYWPKRGSFFPGKNYIDRGISGQTTAQLLVRFRQDVINLHPKVVVILGGTNDVAGNLGPMTPEMTEGNWQSMAELAQASGITPVLASITPASSFPWRKEVEPVEKIRTLNAWMKQFCKRRSLEYLDVYSALADKDGAMREGLSLEGVHPNAQGYAVMQPLAEAAIAKALKSRTMVLTTVH
jgi:lysophospholipase L1-like esterase